ncbi:MAG TPA: Na+/H+ antiporter subunit B [Candidatus Thermoplasmatota archaeon]|nr:Na+/H+ antiporter subunit B [Candidatus Thermoplasmatota archaeon]
MNSLILQTATRFLFTLLLLFSVFLVLRGHNEPGGGFIGGLVAAGAFALYAIAYDTTTAKRLLRVDPVTLIGGGLLTSAGSGVLPLLLGKPFMTGLWTHLHLPLLGDLEVGTPVLFDLGVFLVVLGVSLLIILALAEE